MTKEKVSQTPYTPTKEERDIAKGVYDDLDIMISERNKSWPQFNERSLQQFKEDNENRVNSYIETKENQGKEEWQSNVAFPVIRNKMKKMIAGFSLTVPDLAVKAYGNLDYSLKIDRAELAKWLIKGSYLQEENPVLSVFWEAWEVAMNGTIIEYEGYLKTIHEQRYIKKYDPATGDVEEATRKVNIDDQCISLQIPLLEFYIKDFKVHNVQDQLAVAWVRYLEQDTFEYEFGSYDKAKYVKTKSAVLNVETDDTFYKSRWSNRVKDNEVELVRYYNKIKDQYVIIANGVVILEAPLLWMSNGKKVYPFAKSIWEPFSTKYFFYGNSLPNIMLSEGDTYNTLFNSVLDKEYRELVPTKIIGAANQEAFDLEDEYLSTDTTITVDNVDQIKFLEYPAVNASDLKMIELIAGSLSEDAPSIPDLLSSKDPTAREVLLAEEKLKELRTVYHEMISDLWRQKYALRLANIQLNYPSPRVIFDQNGKEKKVYRTYIIDNAVLDTSTGERGVLAVQFKRIPNKQRAKVEEELAVEEKVMKDQGINFRKVILTPTFFDNTLMQMEVIPESINKVSLARLQTKLEEKLRVLTAYFPEVLVMMQRELLEEASVAFEGDTQTMLKRYDEYQAAKKEVADQTAKQKNPIQHQPAQEVVPQQQLPQ